VVLSSYSLPTRTLLRDLKVKVAGAVMLFIGTEEERQHPYGALLPNSIAVPSLIQLEAGGSAFV
jgi:hypothetical protein